MNIRYANPVISFSLLWVTLLQPRSTDWPPPVFRCCRHALPLFTSLLNVVCAYDPVGYGFPYNHLLFSDHREQLVEQALQILIVTLEHEAASAASSALKALDASSSPSAEEEPEVDLKSKLVSGWFMFYIWIKTQKWWCSFPASWTWQPLCELSLQDTQRRGRVRYSRPFKQKTGRYSGMFKSALSLFIRTWASSSKGWLGCSTTPWSRLTSLSPPRRSSSTRSCWFSSGSSATSTRCGAAFSTHKAADWKNING